MSNNNRTSKSLESRARRAAKRVGLYAMKSRERAHVPNLDNFGEFMLVDEVGVFVVAGARFSLSAEDVLAFCADRTNG